ncbi:hypothetical protein AB3K78_09615 [Leucobacter sp. HNU]|uniref:hypothetical protein n=1 Tax=Leucobacter sp. HNU TaxID=3236805 RepID=UPI003A7FBEE1
MTWQDEKAKAQATMRDIIEQVPKDVAVSVDMAATGTLLNCSPADSEGEKKYLWAGVRLSLSSRASILIRS